MKHCAGVKFPTLTTAARRTNGPICVSAGAAPAPPSAASAGQCAGLWPVTRGGMAQLETLASLFLHDDDDIHRTTTYLVQAGWLLELHICAPLPLDPYSALCRQNKKSAHSDLDLSLPPPGAGRRMSPVVFNKIVMERDKR